ncbi:MAG: sugar phosphate isomerase/epimerase, partial [Armatimonadetes bacterium]|nr:sugar phosphate isomerase/epimerase [Armatimonadota bacterium]
DLKDSDQLARFRNELTAGGVRVCAFLCSQNFNHAERDAHIAWVVQAVRAADVLGTPALRIDSAMSGQAELSLDDRIRIFADAVTEVLRQTPNSSVALGIENHGRQGNDPAWMRGVIQRVGSPRVGLTLDVGNWYWYGHPLSRVYEIYREFGPLVKATHVKNINYPAEIRETQREIGYEYGKYCCPLDEGNLDMARVASILKACGYDGALTIEDESLGKVPDGERAAVLQRDVDHLKQAVARA